MRSFLFFPDEGVVLCNRTLEQAQSRFFPMRFAFYSRLSRVIPSKGMSFRGSRDDTASVFLLTFDTSFHTPGERPPLV